MFEDPSVRKSLIVSVVASVLVILFVQPFLNFSGDMIQWVLSKTAVIMSDSIYKDAALGMREKFSFLLLIMVFQLIFMVLLSSLYRKFFRTTSPQSSIDELSDVEKVNRTNKRKIISFFTGFTSVILVFWLGGMQYVGFQMNASFSQRVTILSPYISEQDVKVLKSEWAQMQSREDYEAINEKILSVAESNNIVLPRLLWN
ncbi:TPA: hypothetical protein NJ077_004590 [Vibrio parahaemolyticus]|nr:hypothetical protein [Vibrio parahaemolyticus]